MDKLFYGIDIQQICGPTGTLAATLAAMIAIEEALETWKMMLIDQKVRCTISVTNFM